MRVPSGQSVRSVESATPVMTRPISGVFQHEQQEQQRRHQPNMMAAGAKSDMSSILSGLDIGAQYIKPSTRVFHPPGGLSSNIFATDSSSAQRSSVQVDPRRNQTQNSIFGDNVDENKHIPRRDPNRSSVSDESSSYGDEHQRNMSKKMFSQNGSSEDVMSAYPPQQTGRKMGANSGGAGGSFSLQHNEYIPQQPQAQVMRRDPNARSEENYVRPSSRYGLL